MSKNSTSWDRNHTLALIGVIIAISGVIITITLPEIRTFFGLEKETVPPHLEGTHPTVQSSEPNLEIEQEPSEVPERPEELVHRGSTQYTIHENQSQFVEVAQTSLSVAFHDVFGEKVSSLTIAPTEKDSSVHAVLEGYTQKFTSSVGAFFVQILHVDYEGKNIEIQVTKNREFSSDGKKSRN